MVNLGEKCEAQFLRNFLLIIYQSLHTPLPVLVSHHLRLTNCSHPLSLSTFNLFVACIRPLQSNPLDGIPYLSHSCVAHHLPSCLNQYLQRPFLPHLLITSTVQRLLLSDGSEQSLDTPYSLQINESYIFRKWGDLFGRKHLLIIVHRLVLGPNHLIARASCLSSFSDRGILCVFFHLLMMLSGALAQVIFLYRCLISLLVLFGSQFYFICSISL